MRGTISAGRSGVRNSGVRSRHGRPTSPRSSIRATWATSRAGRWRRSAPCAPSARRSRPASRCCAAWCRAASTSSARSCTRRAEGGDPADLPDLIARLPEVLSDRTHAPGRRSPAADHGAGRAAAGARGGARRHRRRRPPRRPARPSTTTTCARWPTHLAAFEQQGLGPPPRPLRAHRRAPGRDHPAVQDRRGHRRLAPPVVRGRLTVARGSRVACTPREGGLEHRWRDLGEFIREQRRVGHLSLRKLSELAGISNPYLSQIERGLRKPSAEILQQIARALRDLRRDALRPGRHPRGARRAPTSSAEIRRDPHLTEEQKKTLIRIYESFRHENEGADRTTAEEELVDAER